MSERFIDNYFLYLLAQASAVSSDEFHRGLAARGVKIGHWRVMATLYPDQALGVGALAEASLTKQPTMSRVIDKMVEAGTVERLSEGDDRRHVTVRLTPAGKALADELTAEAKAHEARLLDDYSHVEKLKMKQMLTRLAGRE
ncbi:MAG: MarR family winged helix-turn-helix transcriptional regulator [Pikeienuella sp.]